MASSRRLFALLIRDYSHSADGFATDVDHQLDVLLRWWCAPELGERALTEEDLGPAYQRRSIKGAIRKTGLNDVAVPYITGHGVRGDSRHQYLTLSHPARRVPRLRPPHCLPGHHRARLQGPTPAGDRRLVLFWPIEARISDYLHTSGHPGQAFPHARLAHRLAHDHYGPDHTTTRDSTTRLALCLQTLGDHQAARELDEDSHPIPRRVLGEDHPNTLRIAHSLVAVLRDLDQHD